MHRASVTEAKNNLSALLDRVRRGESVLILDRRRPVARLEPIGPGDTTGDAAECIRGLVRDGVLAPARKPLSARSLPRPVRPRSRVSIVDALRADREE